MKKKITLLAVCVVSTLLLFLLFLFVDPVNKSILFVFLPVLLFWSIIYSGVRLLLEIFLTKQKKLYSVGTFVGVSLIVLLIVLSGIGQITLRDVILVSSLAVVSGFYFYRTWV